MASEEDFMARPTEEFMSYVATALNWDQEKARRVFRLGRIAMAMELMTVAKIIEDHSLLMSKEDTISVLHTLIVDQDLLDDADRWYHELCDWRRIKISDDVLAHGVLPSERETLPDTTLPPRSNGAPRDTGQMRDPPSSD